MEKETLREEITHGTVSFPLAYYCWTGENHYHVKIHWHSENEIVFFEKGFFQFTVNLQEYEIQSPAFLFLNSEEIHSIEFEKGQLESAVVFDLKMLSFENLDAIQYRLLQPLMEGKIQFPRILRETEPGYEGVREAYLQSFRNPVEQNLGSYLRSKAGLYQILGELYDANLFTETDKGKESDNQKIENVKKILLFLQENYTRKITVEEVASLGGMNKEYMCRYFKRMTGKTITEYINEIRLRRAAELLAGTDKKVIDIAGECGYDNIGYFSKRFREEKKMTPRAYRKQLKETGEERPQL